MARTSLPISPRLRRRVQELLDAKGWNKSELARKLSAEAGKNIPPSTVGRFLDDQKTVRRDLLSWMSSALGEDLVPLSSQREAELDFAEYFVQRAISAIQEHVERVRLDLPDMSATRVVGVVSLRIEREETSQVYERLISLSEWSS